MRRLLNWWRFRAEQRWVERDPYGYLRGILDMPDATDEEMDRAVMEFAEALRASMVTTEEAVAALRTMGRLTVEAESSLTNLTV